VAKYRFTPYRDVVREGSPTGDASSRAARVRTLRGGEPLPEAAYVLYWMQMYQRGAENAALDAAVRRANELGLPLLVYQGLNPDYPEANDRIHTFILQSARDVARDLAERGITYRFHLRRRADGAPPPVAAELARRAARVIVDDFPAFILPRMTQALLYRTSDSGVAVEAVDANGLLPMSVIPDRQYAAYTIRPRMHRRIPEFLVPDPAPRLENAKAPLLPVPETLFEDIAETDDDGLAGLVAECDVDHSVPPSLRHRGGRHAALNRLARFIDERLDDYAEHRSDPGRDATSGLSPYLHFGCLSVSEVVREVLRAEAEDESVDDFLEELVIRRELAYNFCRTTSVTEHETLAGLPDWAKQTLAEHADDRRDPRYPLERLERGETHDEIWNAAQRELVATGTFHGYLRMLWGKNVIRWTPSYQEAQAFMVRMHHRYALDGRNPNTYANILWCFGLHDRAFKEGPILGKLRPLKSSSTRRKFDVEPYIERVAVAVEERAMPILEAAQGTLGLD